MPIGKRAAVAAVAAALAAALLGACAGVPKPVFAFDARSASVPVMLCGGPAGPAAGRAVSVKELSETLLWASSYQDYPGHSVTVQNQKTRSSKYPAGEQLAYELSEGGASWARVGSFLVTRSFSSDFGSQDIRQYFLVDGEAFAGGAK